MKIIRWAGWGVAVTAVVVVSAFAITVIRWALDRHDSGNGGQAARVQHSRPASSEDNPCPAQISVRMDYKETYMASEEEGGHSSSHAELTKSGNFTQKLTMVYNCRVCPPKFGEVQGAEGNVAGLSSGSSKLVAESQFRGLPDPTVLWDHSTETCAGSVVDAYTALADELAAHGSPVIVGRAIADSSKPACKAEGNMHEDADHCPILGVIPAHPELQYKLHPESDRPATTPAANAADKHGVQWLDYDSDDSCGTTTTKLKRGPKVTGYEVKFDGQKTFERKRTRAEPGDASYSKHLRVTVRIAGTI
jgi:hypothetical protein